MKVPTSVRLRIVALSAVGILALSSLVTTQGTTYGIAIPSEHPRLWWNAERIARARAWYANNPFTARTYPPESQAFDNAFLYVLTGNAAYCRTAIPIALGIIVNDRAANSPTEGVASDGMRWYGEQVIVTYDWCHAHFTQAERETLVNRWNTYLNNIRQHQWGNALMYESNYNWGYMRNMIEWGIATNGESSMADVFLNDGLINRWQTHFVPYAKSATGGRGGIWQEGSNYGAAIGDYGLMPMMTASLLGRDVYNETNWQRENLFYLIYATSPAPTFHRWSGSSFYEIFPFADDERFREGGFVAVSPLWANFVTSMADFWRDEAAGQYARRWLNIVRPTAARHVRALDRGGAERNFATLPLDYYASGPAYLFGRSQWGPQATTWLLQLGLAHDPGHGHRDHGSWQMWRNGRWVSRETTGYSDQIANYRGTASVTLPATVDSNNSVAHNTLLIDGRGGAGNHDNPTTNYAMRRLESRPEYAFAAVDLTPSFTGRASRVVREFLFVRSLETMVVFDRLDSTFTKTFLAHFEQNPTINERDSIIEGVNGNQTLRVSTLLPQNITYRVVTEGSAVSQFRVELDSSAAGQSYFLNVMQAKGTMDPSVSASLVETATAFMLTLSHPAKGSATITLQKGMTSTGGSIRAAGESTELYLGMQTMTVTAEGPVWNESAVTPTTPANLRIVP